MAGILKPTQARLEGTWTVNDAVAGYGDGITNLFDGVRGTWNSTNVFYWNNLNSYIDITLNQKSRIWALRNVSYINYNKPFKVEKWNGTSFELITTTGDRSSSDDWTPMIELEEGRYKFSVTELYRMDDEWFIEELRNDNLILKSSNQHYSLEEKTIINLPNSSIKNVIKYGIEYDEEIKLDEDFDKIKYVQDTSEVLGEGKIFNHTIDMSNTKVNKIIL